MNELERFEQAVGPWADAAEAGKNVELSRALRRREEIPVGLGDWLMRIAFVLTILVMVYIAVAEAMSFGWL